MSYFTLLEIVDRDSETQLQVGAKTIKHIILRFLSYIMFLTYHMPPRRCSAHSLYPCHTPTHVGYTDISRVPTADTGTCSWDTCMVTLPSPLKHRETRNRQVYFVDLGRL